MQKIINNLEIAYSNVRDYVLAPEGNKDGDRLLATLECLDDAIIDLIMHKEDTDPPAWFLYIMICVFALAAYGGIDLLVRLAQWVMR